jgi:L,D-transpeptidase YcbB
LALVALALTCTPPERAQRRSPFIQLDEYDRTFNALARYRALAAEDDGARLPEVEDPVRQGEYYDGVPRLIRLLRLLGDLPADTVIEDPDSTLYSQPLVFAVQRFQNRHGLEPTGRIDRATLAQLNTPLSFRVHQLELALERWRRNPYDPNRPAIVLNLPEFRLRAYRAGTLQLEMKIVIGQAEVHNTPLFSSELTAVVFRPYWNVPLRIQRDELIPEIIKDPTYLSDHGMEMVTSQGTVLAGELSGDTLEQLRTGRLRLRQMPGPKNALGLAMFVFPNEWHLYLHDTSAPSVFWRARRDLSHGCIRVEKAEDLAAWVLRDAPGWSRDRIVEAMQGSGSVSVKLTRPIQVVATYVTAVALEDGQVHFFDDIYGEDEALTRELSATQLRVSNK